MKFYKDGKALLTTEHPLKLTDNKLTVDKQLAQLTSFKLNKTHMLNKAMTPTVEFCI